MSAIALLRLYRFVFAGLLAIASMETLFGEHHAMMLAAVEIAAILLFLWRRTELLGACALVIVLGAAGALTVAHGQLPTHVLQYAATTIFIVLLDRTLRAAA